MSNILKVKKMSILLIFSFQCSSYCQSFPYDAKLEAYTLVNGLNLTIEGLSEEVENIFLDNKLILADLFIKTVGTDKNSKLDVRILYQDGKGIVNIDIPVEKYKFSYIPSNTYPSTSNCILTMNMINNIHVLETYVVDFIAPQSRYKEELKEFHYSVSFKKSGRKDFVMFLAYRNYSGDIKFYDHGMYVDKKGDVLVFEDIDPKYDNMAFYFGESIGIDGKPSIHKKVMDFLGLK